MNTCILFFLTQILGLYMVFAKLKFLCFKSLFQKNKSLDLSCESNWFKVLLLDILSGQRHLNLPSGVAQLAQASGVLCSKRVELTLGWFNQVFTIDLFVQTWLSQPLGAVQPLSQQLVILPNLVAQSGSPVAQAVEPACR